MIFIQNILAITTIVVLENDREDFVHGCIIGFLELLGQNRPGSVRLLRPRKIMVATHNSS